MKICVDAGHGLGNDTKGVFDPGAIKKVGTETFAEADIVLRYAHTLRKILEDAGTSVFMTRTSSADAAPKGTRASRAVKNGCTSFVSLHLNSFTDPQSNGVEVLWRDETKDKPLAEALLKALVKVTGFKNRGTHQRPKLAVLKFNAGPAVLIEFGFISNDSDRAFLINGTNREKICKAVAKVVTA